MSDMSIPYKAWKQQELESILHLVSYTKPRTRYCCQVLPILKPLSIIESEVRFKDINIIGRIWQHPKNRDMRLYYMTGFEKFVWLPTPQWIHGNDFAGSARHIANQWFDNQNLILNNCIVEIEKERVRKECLPDDVYVHEKGKPISFKQHGKALKDARTYWQRVKTLFGKHEIGEVDLISEVEYESV